MTMCRFCDDPSCSGGAGCEGRSVFESGTAPAPGSPVFLPSAPSQPDPDAVAAFDQERIRSSGTPGRRRRARTAGPGDREPRRGGRVRIVAVVLVAATTTVAVLLYPDEETRNTSSSPTRAATSVPSLPRDTAPAATTSPSSHRPSKSPSPSATRAKKAPHRRPAPTASKSPTPTHSSAPRVAAYAYVGVRSGLCVDVPHQEGMPLRLAPCAGSSGQTFTYTEAGELRVYGDTCVTATGEEGALGAPVVLAGCGGGDRQQWRLEGDGTIRQHGTCVDAFNGYSDPGTPLQMWECAASTNQQWTRTAPSA